jgi:raffinose/stachyose/melibiose transport system substrate-binding protein
MLLPPLADTRPAGATGAVADAFTISARSEHPDVAAFFLDFMFGPACATSNLDGGYLPFSQERVAAGGGIAGDVLGRWSDVVAADALVPYLGFAAPAMGDTLWPITQSFIGGRSTPDEVIEAVQVAWSDYHGGS